MRPREPHLALAQFLPWTAPAGIRILVDMRTKRRSKRKPPAENLPAAENLPPWLPTGERWEALPQNLRQAVPRLLVPAYRQFVLDAPDELQRSVGLTLVHLFWLELCNQARLSEVVADPTCLAAVLNNPEEMIDRHLNLVAAKGQTTELLVKLRLVNEALARSVAAPPPNLLPPATLASEPSPRNSLPPALQLHRADDSRH
jgi:hypothetical protein